jgi:hypothetical protein
MNQITAYREKPLTVEEFGKLDRAANACFSIRTKTIGKTVPVCDHGGEIIRWEYDLVPVGLEVFRKAEPSPVLLESLQRPGTRQAIVTHLTRLCQHKPYGRGPEGFGIVMEDMTRDLEGCSEWALAKICEQMRLDREIEFFPDTARLVHEVRELSERISWEGRERPVKQAAAPVVLEVQPIRTARQKRRVARICRLAAKPNSTWTRWEKRFFEATREKST